MDINLQNLAEAAVAVRVSLMKKDYALATIDARVLQATLEDLDDKGFILARKNDLKTLIDDNINGMWSDSSYPILKQIGIDPTEEF